MADPFLGEIKIFAGNFAPRGWALCVGQLLSIQQNSALFALLGTTYGGDGRLTFGVPDLRSRAPVHRGQGPGLPDVQIGERAGAETVTLLSSHMPAHGHGVTASGDLAGATSAAGAVLGAKGRGGVDVYATGGSLTSLAPGSGGNTGGSQPHPNMQPSLTLNFIIALDGIFPSRD
jgi:microcystin-dependent protein